MFFGRLIEISSGFFLQSWVLKWSKISVSYTPYETKAVSSIFKKLPGRKLATNIGYTFITFTITTGETWTKNKEMDFAFYDKSSSWFHFRKYMDSYRSSVLIKLINSYIIYLLSSMKGVRNSNFSLHNNFILYLSILHFVTFID